MKKLSVSILLLLFFILKIRTQEIQLKQYVESQLIKNQTQTFTLKIIQKQQNQNLIFIAEAKSLDPYDIPDIVISKGIQTWYCSRQKRTDLCMIPSERVQINDQFSIMVSCVDGCKYAFYGYLSQEFQLPLQKSISAPFEGNGYGFFFSVAIPADLNFTEICVIATVMNAEQIDQAIYILANVGTNVSIPTIQVHNFSGITTWQDGQGIFLNASQIKQGEKIRAFVYGPPFAQINVQAYSVNGNTRNISIQQQIKDYISVDQSKYYMVNVQNIDFTKDSIYVKLTKFNGVPNLFLSNSSQFIENRTFSIYTYQSISQIAINPTIKDVLNLTNILHIKVTGIYQSVYALYIFKRSKQYIQMQNDVTEVIQLQALEFQNFLYERVYKVSPRKKNIRYYDMKIQTLSGNPNFGVKRCKSLQKQKNLECVINNLTEYNNHYTEFQEITGSLSGYNNIVHFIFDYDISKCQLILNQSYVYTYYCVFQIIIYNQNASLALNLNIKDIDTHTYLIEGIPRRERNSQYQFKYYQFQVANTEEIQSIRVYIAVISGNCLLMGSLTNNKPKFGDNQTIFARYDSIIFQDNFNNTVYLAVYSFQQSLFSITATIKRRNVNSMILLKQGFIQSLSLAQNQNQPFYFKLSSSEDFTIHVNILEGALKYTVYPAKNKQIINRMTRWQTYETVLNINNEYKMYSDTLEFIIQVIALKHAQFSIKYQLQNTCSLYTIGLPINFKTTQNQQYCIKYQLNKLQDLQIVLNTPSYIFSQEKFQITYEINNTVQKINTRFTTISKQSILSMCPGMEKENPLNNSYCGLQLKFLTQFNQSVTLSVQYTVDEIYLFDGLLQKVEAYLSSTLSRRFYFQLQNKDSVSLYVRSKTDVTYVLVAKLVDSKDYVSAMDTIYPSYNEQGQNIIRSQTTEFGFTSLIVKKSFIQQRQCEICLLVFSVFTKNEDPVEVNFKIQANQRYTRTSLGSSKNGFVEKDSTVRYEFSAPPNEEVLISLNSLITKCAKINIYNFDNDTIPLQSSNQGHLILQAKQEQHYYIAQVYGSTSCNYYISFAEVKKRIYDLWQGIPMDFNLKENQSIYFMYYNTKNISFRVLGMIDYGDVDLYARTLTNKQLNEIEKYIQSEQKQAMFDGKQIGTLQISNSSKDFCIKCYYLIQVKAQNKSSATFLLHSEDSPIPIRDNKFIRDKVLPNDTIQYVFHSISTFNISIELLYGNPSIEVIKAGNIIFKKQQIKQKSKKYTIPHSTQNQNNVVLTYDQNSEFRIVISGGLNASGFLLTVKCHQSLVRIRRGVPFNINLQANKSTQIEFISHQSNIYQFLTISVNGKYQDFQYEILCESEKQNTTCTNKSLIVSEVKTDSNILSQLLSLDGTYFIKLLSRINLNLSIMIANSELKHLPMNIPLLMKTNYSDNNILEIYSPIQGQIMIQAYQCKGQIQISASSQFQKLLNNQSVLAFEHTRTGGHYVGKAEVQSGLYFFLSRPHKIELNSSSVYLTKYSFYEKDQFPYNQFQMLSEQITFKVTGEKVIFIVKKVTQLGGKFDILQNSYTLYISSCHDNIISATQCQYKNSTTFNITQNLGPNITDIAEDVKFQIDFDIVQKISDISQYFYVGVVCSVQVIPKLAHFNTDYKFIYNIIQMSKIRQELSWYARNTWFSILMWFVLPVVVGLIVLLLTLRYCVRKIYMLPDNNLNEQEMKQIPNVSQNISGNIPSVIGLQNNNAIKKQQV